MDRRSRSACSIIVIAAVLALVLFMVILAPGWLRRPSGGPSEVTPISSAVPTRTRAVTTSTPQPTELAPTAVIEPTATIEPTAAATATVPEPTATGSAAEFELYFYRPLVVEYNPEIWIDRSEPDNKEMMVNTLQHREMESCTIGVVGPSGFYPADMPQVTLGELTYELYEGQNSDSGLDQRIYFLKSAATDAFDEVFQTLGIPILYFQSNPSQTPGCQSAAEAVFATLHPSERLINMPYCEKLARDYRTPPNYTTYCDSNYNFAFNYPKDWEVFPIISSASSASPALVRRAQTFGKPDMSNYIRVDTYSLPYTTTLEERVETDSLYEERDFPEHEYAELKIGGKRAYAIVRRWHQDYSAVYLYFEHGGYYSVMEVKAISAPKLDTNWKIARSIQVPGATIDDNFFPEELLIDSYRLVR